MHLKVLLKGRLEGMGRQSICEVMAKKSTSRVGGEFEYSEPVIIHATAGLPEGAYTLYFENVSMPVLHKGVLWVVQGQPPAEVELAAPAASLPSKPGKGAATLARRLLRDRRKKK